MEKTFRDELTELINRYSIENNSNTPDWILAHYLNSCLDAFEVGIRERDRWYGVSLKPGQTREIKDHGIE